MSSRSSYSRSRTTPQLSHLGSIHEEPNPTTPGRLPSQDLQPLFPELRAKSHESLLSSSSNISSPTISRFSRKGSTSALFNTPPPQPFSLGKATIQHDIFSVLHEANEPSQIKYKGIIDIPSVPKTFIRKIKNSDFDGYLSEMTEVFGEYQRLKRENAELLDPKYNAEIDSEPELKGLPIIQGLPDYFYDPDFSLDQAKTFHAVCSLVKTDHVVESEINLMTSPEIQELLTQNLDTVETHLVQEIGRRSRGFFSALSMLQDLEEETNSCVALISELRGSLDNIRQRQVNDSKTIIQLKRRRENMVALKEAINALKGASNAKAALEGLIENRDPLSAINLIEDLSTQLYSATDFPSRSNSIGSPEYATSSTLSPRSRQGSLQTDFGKGDRLAKNSGLGQLTCLSTFNSFLDEKRSHVTVLLESRFTDIFFGDLMRSIVTGIQLPAVMAQLRLEGEKYLCQAHAYPTDHDFDETQRNIIKPLLTTLHSAQHLSKMLDLAVSSLTEGLYTIQIQILSFFFDDNFPEKGQPPPRSQKEWE